MIPSTWYRRVVLFLFTMEVAGALLWLSSEAVNNDQDRPFAQTVAGLILLLGIYAGGPLTARFLAPQKSTNAALLARLERMRATLPVRRRVFLYDHKAESAVAVGIIASHARIYITSGMLERLSDEGLRGILAHEETHIREHHILLIFCYASVYAFAAQIANSAALFVAGFVAFMTLRRIFEYRADAGAAELVGKAAVIVALDELHRMFPTQRGSRFFVFASPYPTLPMRVRAVVDGTRPLF